MLNSKNFKKIFTAITLNLFLVGLLLPITTNAAGGWYFATMSGAPAAAADGPSSTEAACKTARESEITRNYTNGQIHVNVSKCVSISKNNATTQDVIDKDPIPWPDVSEIIGNGQTNIYWLMYHNANNIYSIENYPTKEKCDEGWQFEKTNTPGIILDVLCSTTKPTDPTTISITPSTAEDQEKNYYPLANLPGLGDKVELAPTCTFVTDANGNKTVECIPAKGFGDYLNILIRLFIGICAILAMIMIVMGGIEYMTSELVSSKQAGKETITKAILGLLLALAAFAILNTINPKLLDVGLQEIATANVTDASSAHEEQIINNLGNNKTFKRTKYYNCIKTLVADKYPHCIMQAMVQVESGGLTSQIIGHDENVKNKDIKSRREFVASGITFLKKTFTSTNDVAIAQQNDDGANAGSAPNPNSSTLGLDTRFSHSVGMFGLTFFPPNFTSPAGPNEKIKDIYNNTNDADIKWAINHANTAWNKCNSSWGVFSYWGAGGSCNTTDTNSWNYKIAKQKQSLYEQCVAQDTDTTPVATTCPTSTSLSGSSTQTSESGSIEFFNNPANKLKFTVSSFIKKNDYKVGIYNTTNGANTPLKTFTIPKPSTGTQINYEWAVIGIPTNVDIKLSVILYSAGKNIASKKLQITGGTMFEI